MNCSTPGFPILLYCLELSFTISQTCPLSQCSHLTILSSVTHFSSCPQSFLAWRSFPISWLFASSGQRTRASASVSVLPMNIQVWFHLGLTGLIFLLSKELSRVFSSQFNSINSLVLNVQQSNLPSIQDYWKSHQSSQFSCSVVSDSVLWPHRLKNTRPPCPSPTPGVYSNSCPLSQWCHPNHLLLCRPLLLLPSIVPRIRAFSNKSVLHIRWKKYGSFSSSVLPMNSQDWFPLGWTVWISLKSKGLSRVFSNTTVQKHQFFGTQLSL